MCPESQFGVEIRLVEFERSRSVRRHCSHVIGLMEQDVVKTAVCDLFVCKRLNCLIFAVFFDAASEL